MYNSHKSVGSCFLRLNPCIQHILVVLVTGGMDKGRHVEWFGGGNGLCGITEHGRDFELSHASNARTQSWPHTNRPGRLWKHVA